MRNHVALGCVAVLWLNSLLRAQTAADYLPLNEGEQHTYVGVFKGKKYEPRALRTARHALKDKTAVHYFSGPDPLIGSDMFGRGCYFHAKDGLYAIEAFWKHDLDTVSSKDKYLLIPAEPKVGKSWSLTSKSGKLDITIEIKPPEDVKVPAGEFKNCLKLHLKLAWKAGSTYDTYVWLAPGVGVVKWHRDTGRVEELVKFEKAKK